MLNVFFLFISRYKGIVVPFKVEVLFFRKINVEKICKVMSKTLIFVSDEIAYFSCMNQDLHQILGEILC